MGENTTDDTSNADSESDPFQKLETAADHEDRAERLRAEAKRDILDEVTERVPFDAETTVKLKGGAFVVTCVPKTLADTLADEFEDHMKYAARDHIRTTLIPMAAATLISS